MADKFAAGFFIFICYSLIGLSIGMFLDTAYDIDIPVGATFVWPFIIILVTVLDVIKIVRILIKSIKK